MGGGRGDGGRGCGFSAQDQRVKGKGRDRGITDGGTDGWEEGMAMKVADVLLSFSLQLCTETHRVSG